MRAELETIVMEADVKRMHGDKRPAPPMRTTVVGPRQDAVLPPVPGQPRPHERSAGGVVTPSMPPTPMTVPDSATFAQALNSETTPFADTSTTEEFNTATRVYPPHQPACGSDSRDESEYRRSDATDIARSSSSNSAAAVTIKAGDAGH